jgi:hypothetical protein
LLRRGINTGRFHRYHATGGAGASSEHGNRDQRNGGRSPGNLAEINGAFLCSGLMEIRAVSQLGQRVVPTAELPMYKSMVAAFRALTHQ